jgi:hypothetical protein
LDLKVIAEKTCGFSVASVNSSERSERVVKVLAFYFTVFLSFEGRRIPTLSILRYSHYLGLTSQAIELRPLRGSKQTAKCEY